MSTPITGLFKIAEDIYAAHLAPLHARIEVLTAQRDALKTVLGEVLYLSDHGQSIHPRSMIIDEVREALELAKGDV